MKKHLIQWLEHVRGPDVECIKYLVQLLVIVDVRKIRYEDKSRKLTWAVMAQYKDHASQIMATMMIEQNAKTHMVYDLDGNKQKESYFDWTQNFRVFVYGQESSYQKHFDYELSDVLTYKYGEPVIVFVIRHKLMAKICPEWDVRKCFGQKLIIL